MKSFRYVALALPPPPYTWLITMEGIGDGAVLSVLTTRSLCVAVGPVTSVHEAITKPNATANEPRQRFTRIFCPDFEEERTSGGDPKSIWHYARLPASITRGKPPY